MAPPAAAAAAAVAPVAETPAAEAAEAEAMAAEPAEMAAEPARAGRATAPTAMAPTAKAEPLRIFLPQLLFSVGSSTVSEYCWDSVCGSFPDSSLIGDDLIADWYVSGMSTLCSIESLTVSCEDSNVAADDIA